MASVMVLEIGLAHRAAEPSDIGLLQDGGGQGRSANLHGLKLERCEGGRTGRRQFALQQRAAVGRRNGLLVRAAGRYQHGRGLGGVGRDRDKDCKERAGSQPCERRAHRGQPCFSFFVAAVTSVLSTLAVGVDRPGDGAERVVTSTRAERGLRNRRNGDKGRRNRDQRGRDDGELDALNRAGGRDDGGDRRDSLKAGARGRAEVHGRCGDDRRRR